MIDPRVRAVFEETRNPTIAAGRVKARYLYNDAEVKAMMRALAREKRGPPNSPETEKESAPP